VDDLAAEVAGASHEQANGITQINRAVGQMDKVTQANAASAEESAAAAQELNAQATLMKRAVAELMSIVGETDGETATAGSGVRNLAVQAPSVTPQPKALANVKSAAERIRESARHSSVSTPPSEASVTGDFKDF
jgi:hypothetical protein